MADRSEVFRRTLEGYLRRIGGLDLALVSERTGAVLDGAELLLPYFGAPYTVSAQGVAGPDGRRPPFSVSVVLCRYILGFPEQAPQREGWTAYRDFPDAAPLAGWFRQNVERALPRDFSGRGPALALACRALNGEATCGDYPYDLVMEIPVLPHLPVLLLFNDAEGGFPANGLVLFDGSAQKLLDMECLSIVGWTLTVLAARAADAAEAASGRE